MIIVKILEFIIELIGFLISPINIPQFPAGVEDYLNTMISYLEAGGGIVANYIPLDYMLILFGVILTIDVAIAIYHLAMWIIRKLPIASE